MEVTLVDKMGTDLSVVNAARVSYAKTKEVFDDKDEKLIKYPGYMLGTWSVERACVGRWCLEGACPPALEGSIIGGPAETTFVQRFNASTSRRLGDKTAQQMVLEDKGYNLQELWQAQGAAPHRVIANEYSSKLDPTSCRLLLDDGLGEAQPAAAYLFSTARQSEAGEADFILSESFRLILVLSGAIQVLDFEKLERLASHDLAFCCDPMTLEV